MESGIDFSGVFSDKRLDSRCKLILSSMINNKSAVLHKSITSRSDLIGSYRFMNNSRVSYQQLSAGLVQSWSASGKQLLCIQDTTEANYGCDSSTLRITDPDIGPVGNNKNAGFFIHPSLCLEMSNAFPLGFSDIWLYNREWGQPSKRSRNYTYLPIEEKESHRWIASALRSRQQLSEAAYVLFVSDRESDIFELFEQVPDEKADVLVRLSSDRLLCRESEEHRKISEKLQQCSRYTVSVPIAKSGQQQERVAKLEVSYCAMDIASPEKRRNKRHVRVYVIEAREKEESVPEGQAPICWQLITSRKVETLGQAKECLCFYSLRWRVEELFGLIKSQGMELEQSQLSSGRALKILAVLALQAALQLLQLKQGREREDIPASVAFSAQELVFINLLCKGLQGSTEKQRNPYPEASMAYAAWVIARLGGWKGLQSQGMPGIKTFARGIRTFKQQFQGYLIAQTE